MYHTSNVLKWKVKLRVECHKAFCFSHSTNLRGFNNEKHKCEFSFFSTVLKPEKDSRHPFLSFLFTYLVMGLCSAISKEKIGSYLVCMTVATDCIRVSPDTESWEIEAGLP